MSSQENETDEMEHRLSKQWEIKDCCSHTETPAPPHRPGLKCCTWCADHTPGWQDATYKTQQDEGRRTRCLHWWCFAPECSQRWWSVFPRCWTFYVTTSNMLYYLFYFIFYPVLFWIYVCSTTELQRSFHCATLCCMMLNKVPWYCSFKSKNKNMWNEQSYKKLQV